jgi:hypothetical protein
MDNKQNKESVLEHKIHLWMCIIREILFTYDCSLVIQCIGTEVSETITFDRNNKETIISMSNNNIHFPVSLFFVILFMKSMIPFIEFRAVLFSSKKIIHDILPSPEIVDERYYYHF